MKERVGEPDFEPGVPTCPAWLKGEARKQWKALARPLARAGVLATVDQDVLAAACEVWADFLSIRLQLQADPSNWRLMAAKDRVLGRWINLSDRLGLSPAARARVRTLCPSKEGEDDGKFFGEAV